MSNDSYIIINGRRYPSWYQPGTHWAADEAWGIMNLLKEGALSDEARALMAGAITGALVKAKGELH